LTASNRKTALSALALVTGAIAWSGHTFTIPIGLLLFPLLSRAQSRGSVFFIAFSYYAGSTWPVVPGGATFFGPHAGPFDAVMLWSLGAAILTVPLWLLWSSSRTQRAWRIPLAVVLTAVPPIGIFNVASQLTTAGVIFPGTRWVGLLAILVIVSCLSCLQGLNQLLFVLAVSCFAVCCNVSRTQVPTPKGWEAVDTRFGGDGLKSPSAVDLYNHEKWIRQNIANSSASVLVFPESVVYRWTPSTDVFWKPELDDLRSNGRTVLVGAGVSLTGPDHYLNVIFVRGKDAQDPFLQRIPVPWAMWRPFDQNSVPMRPLGPSVIDVSGERVAPIICYEQLLPWPILTSALQRPTIVVGMANDYWAKDTYIPNIQHASLDAWTRLFSLPLLTAVNQ
jgi:apolipoprotein N-acyltransferase